MDKEEVVSYISKYFPVEATSTIAQKVKLSVSQVRRIAKTNNISKSPSYLSQLKKNLIQNRRKRYETTATELTLTHLQEQLIYGSLLGDGYISTGAKRSINCYYQEHFTPNQLEYRIWKLKYLENLGFSIKGNYLRSTSNKYFTKLRSIFYPNNKKCLPLALLTKCTHPIFLTSLYLDDGSLVFSTNYNKNTHTVICSPSIILYTLNLTSVENQILAEHINSTFDTNFVVSGHPHGNKTLLKINKESEVRFFLNVIKPYTSEIPSMFYKSCLEQKLNIYNERMTLNYGPDVQVILSSSDRHRNYTNEEIKLLIRLKQSGEFDKDIANALGRSYWSIVYKIRELRRLGRI